MVSPQVVYIHVYVYIRVYTCVCVCVSVCLHTYIHIHTYIHAYIRTYTYTHTHTGFDAQLCQCILPEGLGAGETPGEIPGADTAPRTCVYATHVVVRLLHQAPNSSSSSSSSSSFSAAVARALEVSEIAVWGWVRSPETVIVGGEGGVGERGGWWGGGGREGGCAQICTRGTCVGQVCEEHILKSTL